MSSDEVHVLVAEVLGIEKAHVRGELAFGDVPEWDSLNHVNLILALEQRLDVEIGPEQMVELTTVALIEGFAAANGSAGTASPAADG